MALFLFFPLGTRSAQYRRRSRKKKKEKRFSSLKKTAHIRRVIFIVIFIFIFILIFIFIVIFIFVKFYKIVLHESVQKRALFLPLQNTKREVTMKKPKAALIYYDNYNLITGLSNEQLGVLFRAVMDYGKLLLRGESIPIDRFRRGYPDMADSTYGFFAFMADTVRRDAATYREKCANYSAAAQRRWEERQREQPPAEKPRPGNRPSERPRTAPPQPHQESEEMAKYVRQLRARYTQREAERQWEQEP